MDNIHVFGSLPEASLFNFPPKSVPAPLAPVPTETSILRPFNIPENVYQAWLQAWVPVTIAAVYAVTVKSLTRYNLSHGKKPWAISKTRVFFVFVVLHNLLLAAYSAWTFVGMVGGMRRSVQSPFGPQGLAGTADSLCRLHGAPGLGNAVFFNEATGSWESAVQNAAIEDGLPSYTQAGRIWNEGLNYYGWLFYLSKFYEVLDTFIILAKGKPSSTLQTYHHAGAMICMWAGMRYMAIPIWVFVVYNSFIHTMMYIYYTFTACSISIPTPLKRALTTMQITQFILGASYTMAHSFISYVIPVTITRPASEAKASPIAAMDPALQTAGALDSLKQLLFGAAKADNAAETAGSTPMTTETVYVTQPCIVTTGETYAIWMNVLYLAPLTYLFVSFFITSYLKRSSAAQKKKKGTSGSDNVALAEKAGWDAAKGVGREVYGGGQQSGNNSDDSAGGATTAHGKSPKAKRRSAGRKA